MVVESSEFALGESDGVGPFSGFIGRKMGAPLVAAGGRGFSGFAISGEIAWHAINGGAGLVAEGDIEPVISEWIGVGVGFVGGWTSEGESDFMPLLELAGDADLSVSGEKTRDAAKQEEEKLVRLHEEDLQQRGGVRQRRKEACGVGRTVKDPAKAMFEN